MNPAQNSNETPKRGGLVRMVYFFGRLVKRTWLPVLITVLMFMAVYGLSGMIIGHRYSYALRKLKAQGLPITINDLKQPHIPDEQNGAVLYEKAFKIIKDYDKAKNKESGKAISISGRQTTPGRSRNTNQSKYTDIKDNVIRHERYVQLDKESGAPINWAEADKESRALVGILPLVEKALSRPEFNMNLAYNEFMPLEKQGYSWATSMRNLIRVLAFQTLVDAHFGRRDQAFRNACVALKASNTSDHSPTIISILVNISCSDIANDSIRCLVRSYPLTPSQAFELTRCLQASDHTNEFQSAIANNTPGVLQLCTERRPGDVYGMWGCYQPSTWWSETKTKMLNEYGAPLIYEDGIVYMSRTSEIISKMADKSKTLRQRKNEFDGVVNDVPKYAKTSSAMLSVIAGMVSSELRHHARMTLTQVLIAAQQYKQQHGAYPDTLAQLRSNSKLSIPLDPYTDKELVYQRTPMGFRVYSVGENQVDDGGKTATRQSKDKYDDVVLNWRW